MKKLAVLFSIGAVAQLWMLWHHRSRGESWGADAAVAALCAITAVGYFLEKR